LSGAAAALTFNSLFARLISHQPAVLFSQNEPATSNQPQPASSTLLSEQTSTSHQPPANRTGCKLDRAIRKQQKHIMLLHFLIAISHALGIGIDPGICMADTSEAKTSK
jgi:hypothetical protein